MKHTILITASLLAIFACGKDPGTHPGGNNDNPGDTEEPELPVDPPVDPSAVCIDTPLMIFSNGKPTVGTGKITVEDASGKVVDMIDLSDMQYVTTASDGVMLPKEKIGDTTPYNTFMDILRCGGSQKRIVHYTPIRVTDMGLEVHLHSAVLDFDKVYTFKAEAGVIQGMTEPYSLQFKTKPKPASKTQLNVNPDGSGDFCTVQGAITYSYSLGKSAAVTINIAPATYPEMLYIRDRENLTLKGTAHRATCIIAYTNCEKYEGGSGGKMGFIIALIVLLLGGSGAGIGSMLGGGDGGTARELLKYDGIQKIDLVEIDEVVVNACKKFLPQTAACLENSRVNVFIDDALKFIRRVENHYDLILVDPTDPFGPGEGLFTKEFYGNCFQALTDAGIMVNQHENPYYAKDAMSMKRAHRRIATTFPIVGVYQVHIPTYPSGHWLFGFASKKFHPISDFDFAKWKNLDVQTKYYNPKLHCGAFALPTYVEKLLQDI